MMWLKRGTKPSGSLGVESRSPVTDSGRQLELERGPRGKGIKWSGETPAPTYIEEGLSPRLADLNVSNGHGLTASDERREPLSLDGREHLEIESRHRRAVANALFDARAATLLEQFSRQTRVPISTLPKYVDDVDGWLKLGLLLRAYFIEIVGGDIRVTPEGAEAIRKLDKFLSASQSKDLPDTDA